MQDEIKKIQEYCLNCKTKPCSINGCPLNNDIPMMIHENDMKKAFEILSDTTVLPAICGRICPHEKQCQGACIRGIKGMPVQIGKIEKMIGDSSIKNGYCIERNKLQDEKLKNKKVAVVGGGPAGLTCAAFLAKNNLKVTIFEKHNCLGGILSYGIPEFRLPSDITQKTIKKIIDLGIEVQTNKILGKNIFIKELQEKFDAVFISIGANVSTKMGIDGENLQGVFGGNELLENRNHPDYRNKKVAIIGGGNVAIDCARTIKRMGAKDVTIIYRREKEQMPAETKEIEAAENEGVIFLFKTNIVKIIGDKVKGNKLEKIKCIKTKLVAKEGETRLSPIKIDGSEFTINMDYVVMATGSKPEENVIAQFEKNNWGYIVVNENMQTSIDKVFAGGDIIGEKSTVAWAARSGRNAAEKIIEYLKK